MKSRAEQHSQQVRLHSKANHPISALSFNLSSTIKFNSIQVTNNKKWLLGLVGFEFIDFKSISNPSGSCCFLLQLLYGLTFISVLGVGNFRCSNSYIIQIAKSSPKVPISWILSLFIYIQIGCHQCLIAFDFRCICLIFFILLLLLLFFYLFLFLFNALVFWWYMVYGNWNFSQLLF